MALREKVTESILKYTCISEAKADEKRRFYYKNYEDNLYCPLGEAALEAYDKGSGAETRPTEKTVKGKLVQTPAKMASIVSSSAMTFNLLGNDPVTVTSDEMIPKGIYDVQYEKQMYTIRKGSKPANLDAFLSNESGKTAVFCEMKFLEWLGAPGVLKDAYLDKDCFFESDNSADAYAAFRDVIMKLTDKIVPNRKNPEQKLYHSIFSNYDAWQMLKHLLAIYNYTSFVTKASVDSFGRFPSMAGKYSKIILLNVVNEFPAECIEDEKTRDRYKCVMDRERSEAQNFIDVIMNSKIPKLFVNNCKAGIEIKCVSARQFADEIEMSPKKRDYLKRYFT